MEFKKKSIIELFQPSWIRIRPVPRTRLNPYTNSDPVLENYSKVQDDIRLVKKKTACESNFVYPKAYLFTFQFLPSFSSEKHKATAKTWERSFVKICQNYKHN